MGVLVIPGLGKRMRYEYEGESHDVVENKGSDFLSHDVHDK
jgi:hypothetical protein